MPAKRYSKKSTFRRKKIVRRRKSTFTKRRFVSKRAAKQARNARPKRFSTYNGANAAYVTFSCEVPFTIPQRAAEQVGSDGLEPYHFMFGTHNDALRQSLHQNPGTGARIPTRVYGWNFPVGIGQYLKLYRTASVVSHTMQWTPGNNLPNTVGILDGAQDQAAVRGPMPSYGKINILETPNVVPDCQHPRSYMESHATIKRDPTKPFSITRKCTRTYIEPSMWQHMPHAKGRQAGAQPGFFNQIASDNNVKVNMATPGQQLLSKWFEAYANKPASGFVVSYDIIDVPSNMELGYFTLSWRVKLSGMYRGNKFGDDLLRYTQHMDPTSKVSTFGLMYKGVAMTQLTDGLTISSSNPDVAKNISRDQSEDVVYQRVVETEIQETNANARATRGLSNLSEADMNYLNLTYAPITVSDP